MLRRTGLVVGLLCLATGAARAETAPEALLPRGTQIYFRWDGVESHRPAFEKSALGKMMKGDTGRFVESAFGQMQEGLMSLLTAQQLLGGTPPDRLEMMQADAAEAPKLLSQLGKNGFLVGLELRGLEPPAVQLTVVVPEAGKQPRPLFGALRLILALSELQPREEKIDGRQVYHVSPGPVHVAWWVEGSHLILTVGTEEPKATIARISSGDSSYADNPLFKENKGREFKGFEVGARALVDVTGIARVAATRGPQVQKLLDQTGVSGLQSVVFFSGFEGRYERGVTELRFDGKPRGAFALAGGAPIRMSDIPAIAPDATSWSVTRFDTGAFLDLIVELGDTVVPMLGIEGVPAPRQLLQTANNVLGVDLRRDLLGNMDSLFATYTSPSEGPLNFGQTILIKARDGEKLQNTIDQVVRAVGNLTGVDVSIRRSVYHGVETREVHARQQGFLFVPTYTVHNGWLVFGYFPQNVHGYILRASGVLPKWEPSPDVRETMSGLPSEFLSVSVSDPRPSIRTLMSIAPLVGGTVNSFFPDMKFQVGLIPNAQEATQHLFDNVSVATVDGNIIRLESRASLLFPFELTGVETYVPLVVLSAYAGFAQ